MQSRFCGCVECLSAVLHMACRCCAHGCCCFTLPLSQDEIGGLFKELCGRLDALSNFSFTPKPVVEDMAVKANAPAITMEEVIPTAVSDAKLQAPEEVYRKKRGREGIVVGDDELSREEKKRRRRVRCWLLLFPLTPCVWRHHHSLPCLLAVNRRARQPSRSATARTKRRVALWSASTRASATSTPSRT